MDEPRQDSPLAEAVGAPISREELGRAVERSVAEMAATLQMTHMAALSFDEMHHRLRVVATVGLPFEAVRSAASALSECPAVERALNTRAVVTDVPAAEAAPPEVAAFMQGEVTVVPLLLGDRRVAALSGVLRRGVSAHSAAWQADAAALGEKAALVAECQRLQAANLDMRLAQQRGLEVAAATVEQRPLSEILALIGRSVMERFEVDRVGIYLFDETGLHPVYVHNVSPEYAEAVTRHAAENPIIQRVVLGGDVHVVERAGAEPGYAPLGDIVERAGVGCIAAAPIRYGPNLRGALCLYPRKPRRFTPADLGALHLLADQTALAISVSAMVTQERQAAASLERERLAREMHDTVAQALTGIVLQLESLDRLWGQPDEARHVLEESRLLARDALEETRRAVMGLTPTPLERLDLRQALERELRVFEQQTRVRCAFVCTGEPGEVSAERKTGAFRIAQEALNNVRKHAEAARVRVALAFEPGSLKLVVEDDGLGFDTAAGSAPGAAAGYGIFGMQERARLLGGIVSVESTPGWGTRVILELPCADVGPGASAQPVTQPARAEPARRPAGPLRVVMADDHAVTRHGIRRILEEAPDIEVVGEAEDGLQALDLVRRLRPDAVLLDVRMPRMGGLQVLRHLLADAAAPPAIMLTHTDSEDVLLESIRAGARAYLLKDAAPSQLADTIRAVCRGESLIDPALTGGLLERLRTPDDSASRDLNARERRLLALLATGARNRDIAATLFISEKTVEGHLSSLFAKLGVANRTEAARIAAELGLAEP